MFWRRSEKLHRFPNTTVTINGTLHWDFLRLWGDIQAGIEKGRALQPAGIGVDTWGVDFGLLDGQGHLIGNPVHYRDGRTTGMMGRAFAKVTRAQLFARTGIQFLPINTLISAWDLKQIPIPGLRTALDRANIAAVGQDAGVRVGLTGVDAALAAMGSLVLMSGRGRHRASSLLPTVHIAVVAAGQIVPDLESWLAGRKASGLDTLCQSSNVVVITGPSRTADIAMQLVMGMHGPRELHVVVVPA